MARPSRDAQRVGVDSCGEFRFGQVALIVVVFCARLRGPRRAVSRRRARSSSTPAFGESCCIGANRLKQRLNYDDGLDAFGVHGLRGVVGALLTGVLAHGEVDPTARAIRRRTTRRF